jgi:hypothetical protein
MIVTGRLWTSVGGTQLVAVDSSCVSRVGGGLVEEVEKARICCREGIWHRFEGLNDLLVVFHSADWVWESRDRKVAEKRRGFICCFEMVEESFAFKIFFSARATALGSQIGQTCEEMRILAAIEVHPLGKIVACD